MKWIIGEMCIRDSGFGGKEDMTVQHLAALITYLTRRPVKVRLTRAESLLKMCIRDRKLVGFAYQFSCVVAI